MASGFADDDHTGLRLRDLLLRFPCGVIEGVRWAALCKAFRERYPESAMSLPPCVWGTLLQPWLADIADVREGADGHTYLQVHDAVALTPGCDGQLACWPLLLQRLGEIIRVHGCPHKLDAQAAAGFADDPMALQASDAPNPQTGDFEVMGVLLAQLKPQLKRNWDPGFEERTVGFYNEAGNYVCVKKMKHLVSELLKWRDQRLLRGFMSSVVDMALQAPLKLYAMRNDMVLCCSSRPLPAAAPRWQAPGKHASASASARPGRNALAAPQNVPAIPSPLGLPLPAGVSQPGQACEVPVVARLASVGSPGSTVAHSSNTPRKVTYDPTPVPSRQRMDLLEKENKQLRIENAELKKRVKFGADFLHKEIRRMRIENAELKKRLYFSSRHLAADQGTPSMQQVWVPVPAVLVPVIEAAGAAPSGQAAAGLGAGGAAGEGYSQNSGDSHSPSSPPMSTGCMHSGTVSPAQGSVTPVPHGICYTVPLPAGLVSPPGHAWTSHMGPLMALPMTSVPLYGHDSGSGVSSGVSPFSDGSRQRQLIPRHLLSGSGISKAASVASFGSDIEVGSPVPGAGGEEMREGVPAIGPQSDDRWSCIPSGIVERHKAQFEGPGGFGDFATALEPAPQAAPEAAPGASPEAPEERGTLEAAAVARAGSAAVGPAASGAAAGGGDAPKGRGPQGLGSEAAADDAGDGACMDLERCVTPTMCYQRTRSLSF